jgi:uncharacterized protein YjbJ (UPF0337 family)
MGLDDKIGNKSEELKGEAKEAYGDLTNDPELEGEGKVDQAKAHLKQTGEDVKDNLEDAKDAVKEKLS